MLRKLLCLIILTTCSPSVDKKYEPQQYEDLDQVHEITDVIKDLNPKLDKYEAIKFATLIFEHSKRTKIDWKIGTAILRQESNFDLEAVNFTSMDFGIGQLNHRTIQARKVSLAKLLTDADYAIGITFDFLTELREKYGKMDSKVGLRWYTRYHSGTPYYRSNYRKMLEKHLKTIERSVNERKRRQASSNPSGRSR